MMDAIYNGYFFMGSAIAAAPQYASLPALSACGEYARGRAYRYAIRRASAAYRPAGDTAF